MSEHRTNKHRTGASRIRYVLIVTRVLNCKMRYAVLVLKTSTLRRENMQKLEFAQFAMDAKYFC